MSRTICRPCRLFEEAEQKVYALELSEEDEGYEDFIENLSCIGLCTEKSEPYCDCLHSCRECGSLHGNDSPCRED